MTETCLLRKSLKSKGSAVPRIRNSSTCIKGNTPATEKGQSLAVPLHTGFIVTQINFSLQNRQYITARFLIMLTKQAGCAATGGIVRNALRGLSNNL